MMWCAMCDYRWCWVCGFQEDSCFHQFQFGGALICQFLNAITFGFSEEDHGCKMHWTIRYFLTLLWIATAPATFFIGLTITGWYFIFGCDDSNNCYRRFVKDTWKHLCIFGLPIIIVWSLFLFVIAFPLAAIIVALGIVPFYVAVVIVFFRIVFLWCLCSKKGMMKEEDMNRKYPNKHQSSNEELIQRTDYGDMDRDDVLQRIEKIRD